MFGILLSTRRSFCKYHCSAKYHRIAIVGSGPSGFYSAKYLLEQNSEVRVDVFEKLPVPFGLVRSGVAPDHPEVKSVSATFCDVASSPRFRYFGNIDVSHKSATTGVSIYEMLNMYSGVIIAYGASSDNMLNISGEHLNGVHSARHFVNWYNGHPDIPPSDNNVFDLSKVEHVVVVGQGNVALDCARILTRDPNELAATDISSAALDVLRRSKVKTVSVVGRRGHAQSAFTIKEFRELTKLAGVIVKVREEDVQAGLTAATVKELENNRPKKRIVELIQSVATKISISSNITSNANEDTTGGITASKVIDFRFLSSPTELVDTGIGAAADGCDDRVTGLKISRNVLEGEPHKQRSVVTSPSVTEIIPCQLVLKSIGYRCESISDAIPFNAVTNTVPHSAGRVVHTLDTKQQILSRVVKAPNNDESFEVVHGLYVAGWLKRGPSGIIGTNIPDAKETVAAIMQDMRDGLLREFESSPQQTADPAEVLLRDKRDVIDWEGVLRIDSEEVRRGQLCVPPRDREKILNRQDMIAIAKQLQ